MTPAELARRMLQKAHDDMKEMGQTIEGQQEQIKRLESSLRHQNKVAESMRHEAQEARASERKAWAKAEELATTLKAVNVQLGRVEAQRSTLEAEVKRLEQYRVDL